MSSNDQDQNGSSHEVPANGDTWPAEVRIAEVHDPETLNVYSLVLSAADITHRIRIHSGSRMEVFVAEGQRENALQELAAYCRENKKIPEIRNTEVSFVPTFRAMGPLVVGCLILMYGVTGEWRPEASWFARGAGDSRAILQDLQFYRLITPLTLHADLVHLLSNSLLGLFLLHFFFHLTGNGIGLATLLLTAATANLLNVLLHGPGHLFVGFSTAAFSVIGMLCTMNYLGKISRFRLHFLMPIMAGLALLAILGSSGERTDLGGHLFGLLCGLITGNIFRLPKFYQLRESFIFQSLLGGITMLIIWGCWLIAL